ncbi:MAG: adenylate/guanylate cyclase domain-containing protein [Thermodesulfovibrionales bacterium]|nr:adenylate/guanylate cyclase domain-containing protein [Thermodesulfovibrionales bacterium]
MNKTKAILISVSIAISMVVYQLGILTPFENRFFDLFSRFLNDKRQSQQDIVIVEIDQHSIDALSTQGILWPWPRQMYAPMVEYLSQASAVYMDIIFSEPSSYGVEDDLILKDAIRKANNVYMPVFLTNQDRALSQSDWAFLQTHGLNIKSPIRFKSAILPIPEIRDFIKGLGNVTISPDNDGVYRRVPLTFSAGDNGILHFVLPYFKNKNDISITTNGIRIKESKPFSDNTLLLRFYTETRPFDVVSAVDILNAYNDLQQGKTPTISPDFFKDRFVFIGLTAAGLFDLKPTAVSSISTGVLIHATTLDNILRNTSFKRIPTFIDILCLIVLCIITIYVVCKTHSIFTNLVFLISSLTMIVIVLAISFKNGYYSTISTPLFSVILSFLIAITVSYATEGQKRRFVKKTFSQYMDEKLVDYLLQHPELIRPGGQKRRVTVFFADIAGFTSISEILTVEQTALMLHTVLNKFTEIIIKNEGVIDKYIGDCVMAFWGSPYSTGKDEEFACLAAIECTGALDEINRDFESRGIPRISMRIGINAGDAITGNLGSDRLFDYTVVGDTVNIASRLEGVNKEFHTKIIVSEEVFKNTNDRFLGRKLGLINVKGKDRPLLIYEIMNTVERAKEDEVRLQALFNKAINLFLNKDIEGALETFRDIASDFPDDYPTQYYLQICDSFCKQKTTLTEDDIIIKMKVK